MNDVGKFIGFIVGVEFLLASLGTLGVETCALREVAAKDCRQGMFSLGAYSRRLVGGDRAMHR